MNGLFLEFGLIIYVYFLLFEVVMELGLKVNG